MLVQKTSISAQSNEYKRYENSLMFFSYRFSYIISDKKKLAKERIPKFRLSRTQRKLHTSHLFSHNNLNLCLNFPVKLSLHKTCFSLHLENIPTIMINFAKSIDILPQRWSLTNRQTF